MRASSFPACPRRSWSPGSLSPPRPEGVRSPFGLEIARLVHGRRAPVQIILTLSEQGSPPDPEWESLGPLIRKPYLASQILEFIARRFNWPIPPDAIPDE